MQVGMQVGTVRMQVGTVLACMHLSYLPIFLSSYLPIFLSSYLPILLFSLFSLWNM
ncbi:hypothetical protein SBF1_140007 [Candidatus Desulfosporosinus infrequens]|uniref:Uncharacterized protein n=1 Tax=Candidatus Desulfosporosinus infrequens TaxID=2043169 RepID=A0A2U3K4Z2_9FIRM|nr:hypothetical protein SBF1_140007 [Candidatus Desulfosporosinus infrequens]